MEDESITTAPNESHPLLPMNVEPSADSRRDGSAETAVDPPSAPNTTTSDDDVTDDCCRRSTPPCADDSGVISSEPKSTGVESVYNPIINMLKDAEKAANEPDYEDKVAARKFGAIKYNPRNQESSFGAVDYCCAIFGCCALCIEG